MKRVCLLLAAVLILVFGSQGCGPEAETGDVFKRYAARSGRYPRAGDEADTAAAGPKKAALSTGAVDVNYLCGRFDPAERADFVLAGAPFTAKPDLYLRRETMEAFKKMWEAARKDGVELRIISGTRTFDQQKSIWEGKWGRLAKEFPNQRSRALKILEYSAMPGASRHHWGTDIDLNDLNNSAFARGGKLEPVYNWLKNNAPNFGFCQPYTAKDETRPEGYNEERWHWSYLPVAVPLLRQYLEIVQDDMLTGFQGDQTAPSIGIVRHYAGGINMACK